MSETNSIKTTHEGNGEFQEPKVETSNRIPAEDKPLDPFDPERLKLSQDFASSLGVKKELLTIPVKKPSKEWWVRVHPDEEMRLQTGVIELKEDREMFIVDPNLWPVLSTESTFSPRLFVTAVNRQGVLFLWPIRLPGADGKIDDWSRSSLEAADIAQSQWVRVAANMSLGAYEVFTSEGALSDPEFPDKSLRDLLSVAFKDKLIDDLNHTVLKKLRGEV